MTSASTTRAREQPRRRGLARADAAGQAHAQDPVAARHRQSPQAGAGGAAATDQVGELDDERAEHLRGRRRGHNLLGRHMHETDDGPVLRGHFRGGGEGGVERGIADVVAGVIRTGHRQARRAQSPHQCRRRPRGAQLRRAAGDEPPSGRAPGVVGSARSGRIASGGLQPHLAGPRPESDVHDDVGARMLNNPAPGRGRSGEGHREELPGHDGAAAHQLDDLGQEPHGIPGGIGRGSIERFETRDVNRHRRTGYVLDRHGTATRARVVMHARHAVRLALRTSASHMHGARAELARRRQRGCVSLSPTTRAMSSASRRAHGSKTSSAPVATRRRSWRPRRRSARHSGYPPEYP